MHDSKKLAKSLILNMNNKGISKDGEYQLKFEWNNASVKKIKSSKHRTFISSNG